MEACLSPNQLKFSALAGQPSVNAFVKDATSTDVQPPRGSEFAMNFIFHVFILFLALTVLFQFIIGPLESKTITKELGDKASEAIGQSFETVTQNATKAKQAIVSRARKGFNALIATLEVQIINAARLQLDDANQAFDAIEKIMTTFGKDKNIPKALDDAVRTLVAKLLALTPMNAMFADIAKELQTVLDASVETKRVLSSLIPLLQRLAGKYSSPDAATVEHNKGVMMTAYAILVGLGLVLVVLVATLAGGGLNMKRPILHVLFENLIVFAVVGAAEFMFFKLVASKFVPVVPSQLSKDVLGALADEFPAPVPAPSPASYPA